MHTMEYIGCNGHALTSLESRSQVSHGVTAMAKLVSTHVWALVAKGSGLQQRKDRKFCGCVVFRSFEFMSCARFLFVAVQGFSNAFPRIVQGFSKALSRLFQDMNMICPLLFLCIYMPWPWHDMVSDMT